MADIFVIRDPSGHRRATQRRRSHGSMRAIVRTALTPSNQQREARMISNRSRLWWQEFSIAGVVVALASCSSGATVTTEPVEPDEPGTVRGELAVYMAD